MIVITDEQRKLLIENVPNAEELFKLYDVNDFLTELDDVIIDKGMNKDYELTELGLKLQVLYDEIYNQND
jgi:predicted transcriptional regulator